MRYGVSVPPFGPFGDASELASLAADAEAAGWDGFFVWDHIVFDPSFHPIVDPWVGLAAVALSTTTIRIGTLITPVARRRPWKLARETVSVDRLSGGRLILGVGLGDPAQWDYGFFGEPTDARERATKLDEGLAVLAGLWTGEPFSWNGEHYHLDEVTFRPPPAQQPRIPIWVGGWWPNRPPMRRAARWDGMCPIQAKPMSPADIAEAASYVAQHRTASGPFDVVVSGATDVSPQSKRDVAHYRDVGATWWVEDVSPWRFGADPQQQWQNTDTAAITRRIQAGPPC